MPGKSRGPSQVGPTPEPDVAGAPALGEPQERGNAFEASRLGTDPPPADDDAYFGILSGLTGWWSAPETSGVATPDGDPEWSGEETDGPLQAPQRAWYGTDTPVVDATGTGQAQPVQGAKDEARSATTTDAKTGVPTGKETRTGETAYVTDADAGRTTATTDTTTRATNFAAGTTTTTKNSGTTETRVDRAATAEQVRSELRTKAEGIDRQLDEVADPAQRAELIRQRDAARLDAARVTPENAGEIADRNDVLVQPTTSATTPAGPLNKEVGITDWNPLDDGKAGHSSATTRTDMTAGTATSVTDTSATSVKVGGGLMAEHVVGSEKKAGTQIPGSGPVPALDEDPAGSTKTTMAGGLVATPDGVNGVQGSIAHEETDADGNTLAMSATRRLDTEGYAAEDELASRSRIARGVGAGKPTLETGGKVKVGRNFTVKTEDVPRSWPPMQDLVVTLNVSANVGADVTAKADEKLRSTEPGGDGKAAGKGAIESGLGGAATLVFRHRMTADEAAAYEVSLAAVENGQSPPSGDFPELGILERMLAVADQAADGNAANALAVVDPGSASGLADGDSVELTLGGTASLKGEIGGSYDEAKPARGSATGGSAGASGGASGQWTRTLKVTSVRDEGGRKLVELTVGFTEALQGNASAKGSFEASQGEVSYAQSDSTGDSVTLRLDPTAPDYDALYGEVIATGTVDGLRRLKADPKVVAHLASATTTAGHGSTTGIKGGLGIAGTTPAELGVSQGSAFSKSLTTGENGASGSFAGTSTSAASGASFGMKLGESAVQTTGTASVDENGKAGLVVQQSESTTGIAPSMDGITARGLIADTPKQTLEKLLTGATRRLRMFQLDDGDFRDLVDRAVERKNWARCADFFVEEYLLWMRLRADILDPAPRADLAAVDPDRAVLLAQCEAFARFFETAGTGAFTIIRNALDHWGMDTHELDAGGEDLGLQQEWPDEIHGQQAEFQDLRDLAAEMPSRLQTMDRDDGAAMVQDGNARADRLYEAIDGCTSFLEPRAKLEMLDAVGILQRVISEAAAAAAAGRDGESPPQLSGEFADSEVIRLERLLPTYKAEETGMFIRIKAYIYEEQADTWSAIKAMASYMGDRYALAAELGRLESLYEEWVRVIKRLRAAYLAPGAVIVEPMVSCGPQDPRQSATEPDVAEFMRLWEVRSQKYSDTHRDAEDRARHIENYSEY